MSDITRHGNVSFRPQGLQVRPAFLLLAAVLLSHPAWAQEGYVHGSTHCYHFKAPAGWQLDNVSGASLGLPMVVLPLGSTWQSAPVAIYTQPATVSRTKPDAIRAQVDEVVRMYRQSGQRIVASRVERLRSQSGHDGELWQFVGHANGGRELVVYFVGPHTVNYFVAQVSSGSDVEDVQRVLRNLASSYREGTDCKPCGESDACKAGS